MRFSSVRLVLMLTMLSVAGVSRAESSFCADCQVQLGIGGTYHPWSQTRGVVVPLTFVWDQDRYELGLFRMATGQGFYNAKFQFDEHTAGPYWGASASRRWELVRQQHWRLLVGFGANYKTQTNELSATHWNFAEQLGVRILPTAGSAVELSIRHWSNAGIRLPNRGQDFVTLTFVLTPASFKNRFASARNKSEGGDPAVR